MENILFANSKKTYKADEEKSIKKELKKIVDNNNNIVVLAGAGASILEDGNGGVTMKDLSTEIDEELKDFKLGDLNRIFNENVDDSEEVNLEELLSKLLLLNEKFPNIVKLSKLEIENEDKIELDEKKLNEIIEVILKKIIEETTCYSYSQKKDNESGKGNYFKHGELIKKLSDQIDHNNGNRLSIVTTNYDMLFEEAANDLDYTIVDGFSYAYEPKFNSDMFDWNFTKPIQNVVSNEIEYNPNVINLLKIHGSVNWVREGIYVKRLNKKISTDDVKKAVMIFPSSEKYMQTYEEPYFDLIVKFQELLRKPNTLLLTMGFSFADNHISEIVSQAIKKNNSLKVLITDYKISKSENELKSFGGLTDLMNESYPVAILEATLNNNLLDYLFDEDEEEV